MSISRSRYAFSGSPLFAAQGDLLAAQSAFDLAPSSSFFKLTTAKATTALLQDGLGDIKPLATAAPSIVTSDTVPDSAGPGDPTLTVDAAHTISTIDTIGDQDFYKVTLLAGHDYQIGMYGYSGGPNGAPNADSYIEIYGADGTTLIVSGDGGADTPANMVNSGFDVLLTYTPETDGTYYIDARAFDQDATNGTTGDGVGDYELFVHDATNDPGIYRPYYDVDSPLYAIDWGTRVNKINQSAANPDGQDANGPRPTGNPQGTPVYSSALDIPALAAAQGVDITGKNVVTIYFAKAGDVFTSVEDPTNPGLPPITITATGVQGFEHLAVMTALSEFSKVADVVYLEVDDRSQADFIYTSYQGTPGPGVSLLGSMEPPDEPNEGLAAFNSGDERWNATDLAQGGFSFTTLIHEFGHGHGLAHPHDNGGHSGIMRGVTADGPVASYTLGDYDLNQGVFTMMSYEDGWQTSPYGNAPTSGGYGYLGSLMAFDIAAIQDKYGVNEDYATGNDVYTLNDENAIGTYYRSIWDAGGTDEIKYVGTRNANIDLRPATLQYEYGGGGWVSYAFGIYGGYTIANGVTIENATSGEGNDTLTGNAADNVMHAGGGNDSITTGDGNDTLDGGAGADTMAGGTGDDTYVVDNVGDVVTENPGEGFDTVMTLTGSRTDYSQLYYLPDNVENLIGTSSAGQGVWGSGADNAITMGSGNDLIVLADRNDYFSTAGGADNVDGGGGNDYIFFGGGLGAGDHVNGGTGSDTLGLLGNYVLTFAADSLTSIEKLAMYSSGDAAHPNDYAITTVDQNVAAGQQLMVVAMSLQVGEHLVFDGSAELDGSYTVMGGHDSDTITGGHGADRFIGGGGADTLTGGAGNDVFQYNAVSDSTGSATDTVTDFAAGDKIDLWFVDADGNAGNGDQRFAFIGSAGFHGVAGELRAVEDGANPGHWFIQGDTNGDGAADLVIDVTVSDGHAIAASDFLL